MRYLEDEVAIYEDPAALQGGHDGLCVIRNILEFAPEVLKNNGFIFMETDRMHYKLLPNLLMTMNSPLIYVSTLKDRFGLNRFLIFRKVLNK